MASMHFWTTVEPIASKWNLVVLSPSKNGLFHAHLGKIVNMEWNPYESPKTASEPVKKPKKWQGVGVLFLIIVVGLVLIFIGLFGISRSF